MSVGRTRRLWHGLETVHAVTYFAPESRRAATELGLRGFWMGYFAFRAAPLGPVGPGVVEAAFANFHPGRVRRAIPDAWERTTPSRALEARAGAAGASLRRCLGDGPAEELAAAVTGPLAVVAGAADPLGRPLFGANRDVAAPDDPVAALWQATTALREHRGDGHVALLAAAGIDGCQAHVLAAAATGAPPSLYQDSRGWSGAEWDAAAASLADRGLLDAPDRLSPAGRELHAALEADTDRLAAAPYRALTDPVVADVEEALARAATVVAAAGDLVYPNPMGLPRVDGAAA